jgi:hypothetical protein
MTTQIQITGGGNDLPHRSKHGRLIALKEDKMGGSGKALRFGICACILALTLLLMSGAG